MQLAFYSVDSANHVYLVHLKRSLNFIGSFKKRNWPWA
nr:MAG TPA: hypothetical protein [Caudoviricetes sp.]